MTQPPQSPGLREAVAKALQNFWQQPTGRSWDDPGDEKSCCKALPGQADWFRKLADVAIAAQSPVLPPSGVSATEAMALAGARSIGNTIHTDNHMVRARECWRAMCAARDGILEPIPQGKAAISASVAGEANPIAWRWKIRLNEAWKYKKRGTVYRVLHNNAPMQEEQTEGRRLDDEPMVVYQDIASGAVYVRPVVEFYDGRFEQIAAATLPKSTLASLPLEWRKEAVRHSNAAAEDDCDIGGDEWCLHRESSRIYKKCANALDDALLASPAPGNADRERP